MPETHNFTPIFLLYGLAGLLSVGAVFFALNFLIPKMVHKFWVWNNNRKTGKALENSMDLPKTAN